MKIGGKVLKPNVPFMDYKNISFIHKVLLRFSNAQFRPFVLHTRDYVFSEGLHESFKSPQKIYTRFNVFYLHCAAVYEKLPKNQQKTLENEIKLFNKHWGMYIYDVIFK